MFISRTTTYLLFVSILLFLLSCKNHGPGFVEGEVIDETNNLPVSGASVELCRGFHGNSCEPIAHTNTDENGHFKIKYYNKANSLYDLTVTSDTSYFNISVNHVNGRKSIQSLILPMKAIAKIKITNNRLKSILVDAQSNEGVKPLVSELIHTNQTVVFKPLVIKVGHATTINFKVSEIPGTTTLSTHLDTTFILKKKLDTLFFTATIN